MTGELTWGFTSPARLGLLALVVLYVLIALVRRRQGSGFVRAACTALAFTVLTVGFAGPSVTERETRDRATVVLALDTSNSMAADDVAPRRFEAAQAAATSFIDRLPPTITVGLVEFYGAARVVVPPTTDHTQVREGITNLGLNSGTAIGEAIFTSLDAIDASVKAQGGDPPPTRIVVLSDGSTQSGRSNQEAAAAARAAGVPVSTIAFGADDSAMIDGQLVPVDDAALAAIAAQTGGSFHTAGSGAELEAVYRDINASVSYLTDVWDLSVWCTGVALALLVLAGFASLLARRPRPAAFAGAPQPAAPPIPQSPYRPDPGAR